MTDDRTPEDIAGTSERGKAAFQERMDTLRRLGIPVPVRNGEGDPFHYDPETDQADALDAFDADLADIAAEDRRHGGSGYDEVMRPMSGSRHGVTTVAARPEDFERWKQWWDR